MGNINMDKLSQDDSRLKKGMLIFFCGKMCAGKSTAAQKMSRDHGAVLLSEDAWLAALYPEMINDLDDYITYSTRLKEPLKPHVQNILRSGVSVVMGFPANTKRQRAWFKTIFYDEGFPHTLVYLEADNSLCLQRLSHRQQTQPERRDFDTEATFHQVTSYFQAPIEEEGFNVNIVPQKPS